jgi:hypothetical protein
MAVAAALAARGGGNGCRWQWIGMRLAVVLHDAGARQWRSFKKNYGRAKLKIKKQHLVWNTSLHWTLIMDQILLFPTGDNIRRSYISETFLYNKRSYTIGLIFFQDIPSLSGLSH